MFASRSVTTHLARGAMGVAALVMAASLSETRPVVALALVAVALVALRGCPMCWTLGLVQTVAARWRGKNSSEACTDGRCALQKG